LGFVHLAGTGGAVDILDFIDGKLRSPESFEQMGSH
jgi:hypothetical protein